ncbi:MAG: F0F1 ATP synthase subunit A [candidate division Zixibacteria bacterium]|nr:F0F1 ATP synthase subunit A [candidate division Zixibacteria bacterium]MDH3937242.1 F0F1 ATP synthase subunit A [candidate division Zixibacteria bacterium]MDH4033968.1 F0F1 ATP synthase subunit A [candidate division Zixibacteria bacterium]
MLLYYAHTVGLALVKFTPMLVAVVGGEHDTTSGDTAAAHDEHGGGYHLPSLVYYLEHYLHTGWLEAWVNVLFAFSIALLYVIIAQVVYKRRELIPGPLQNGVEMVVEGLYNFIYSILGKEAKRYTPFLGTLFVYVLAMNWYGMVPLGHSPSTGIEITGSLAILVFLYAQWTGISRLGFVGYVDHLAGQPRDGIGWGMVILMFPLHIIGEIAKPVSLALRLFGNITGEDTLIAVFVGIGIAITPFIGDLVGLPIQTPFYFLGLLLSSVQALVFTLLSTIYILLMLPHEEHAH